jgi:hypothetical protein
MDSNSIHCPIHCPIQQWTLTMNVMADNLIEYNTKENNTGQDNMEQYKESCAICIPGASGKWNNNLPDVLLKYCRVINVPPSYQKQTGDMREDTVKNLIESNSDSDIIAIGHSEGGARLMRLMEDISIAKNIKALILISPAYSVSNIKTDITKLVNNLIEMNIPVYLIDAEHGFGGSLPCWRWSTRVKFKKNFVNLSSFSKHIMIKNSEHRFVNKKESEELIHKIRSWITKFKIN